MPFTSTNGEELPVDEGGAVEPTPTLTKRKPGRPKRLSEPAKDDVAPDTAPEPVEAADSRHSVADAVRALIDALEVDESFVRAIDIRGNGVVRLYGNDNSLRSVRFEGLER